MVECSTVASFKVLASCLSSITAYCARPGHVTGAKYHATFPTIICSPEQLPKISTIVCTVEYHLFVGFVNPTFVSLCNGHVFLADFSHFFTTGTVMQLIQLSFRYCKKTA